MPKSFLQSKMIWWNVLALVVTVAGTTAFQATLPPSWLVYDVAVAAVGNIVLRFITTQPITVSLPSGANAPDPASR